ncbi:ParB/RepB/Spo0J family partition protein [Streptomyces sp. MA15]|uniref:ParB/RepB/Spo0J family partition protein n=1 Tax=Streptomyces sp. MA15 TaxID=3055061 RepID=UPI0025AFBC30|nr:ParB/RepB/Spo0J family partition protein [Streptomyces sp. MA15]MDN3267055.1 ParB/RepB/Spo0J family partition protein [Streptomyces sp. MA15]
MSSKAEALGSAPAFGAVRGARSSRRNAIERTIGGDNAATAAITELPVTLISENPDNPRNHLRSLEETVESVREVGIILPIVVATVDAYLRDRPDRADDLDEGAQYVVVDGHRRLEASRRVGLATIPVRVDNARVATDESLLETAFIANYHRDDMTDLEEAHALKQLVDYYGSQTKAAKRLGIPQNTISSKLSLLKLTPELQKDLVTGVRKVEHVRNLGKLSPAEQKKKADERAAADRRKAQPKTLPPPQSAGQPADEEEHGEQLSRRDNSGAALAGESTQHGDGAEQSVPEPRSHSDAAVGDDESGAAGQPQKLPYDDPSFIAMHLARKMDEPTFFEMLQLLNRLAQGRNPEAFEKVIREFTDQSAGSAS